MSVDVYFTYFIIFIIISALCGMTMTSLGFAIRFTLFSNIKKKKQAIRLNLCHSLSFHYFFFLFISYPCVSVWGFVCRIFVFVKRKCFVENRKFIDINIEWVFSSSLLLLEREWRNSLFNWMKHLTRSIYAQTFQFQYFSLFLLDSCFFFYL